MIGKTIAHYRVTDKLGEGGMGVVYKALDIRLDRFVALKFLPPNLASSPDDVARFDQEARAISGLNHPNIATLYDVDEIDGKRFLVLEFIPGGTLKSKFKELRAGEKGLAIDEVVRYGIQIAEGLASAHRAGIIHRDVKPDNAMLTKEGNVKLTDFGLARTDGQSRDDNTLVGSLAYMSPEQVRGDHTNHSTDIWSLGVLLYEMVTGRLPFRGEYEQMISYSIGNEQHASVSSLRTDVPPPLEKLIDRCLEKIPSSRFQSVEEIRDELRRIEDTLTHPQKKEREKSIAVLPFANISTDDENKYFSDGLTEEIITNLSKLHKLKVISLASVMQYDRKEKTLRQAAVELGVQYLLEGSVRKHERDLKITAQLTDATQDAYLWAETYRGSLEDVFDIQEKVAARIVRALKVRLTPDEKRTLKKRSTENMEAYQLYLQGRYFWNKRSEPELKTAIKYFEEAIEKDSRFALAWAGIADSYSLLGEYGHMSRKELFPKAQAAANKALELDSRLAEVHTSLASLLMLNMWDWANSEGEFKLAIELNPNYATAHHWYSQWLLCQGKLEEALREATRAAELDPISQAILKDKGLALYYNRQYDKAIAIGKRTLELDPNYAGAYRFLSLSYQGKKMFNEAIAENQRWGMLTGNQPESTISLAQLYAVAGRHDEARKIVERANTDNLMTDNVNRGLALVHAALGENDIAFKWLERSYERREESLLNLKVDPKVDGLRSDPRFIVLLRKIGVEK